MEEETNFCKAFAEKVAGVQGVENKARYLLENFLFEEGWASKTNPKAMKEGYHQTYTYTKSSLSHFIEDFVRLFKKGYNEEVSKILKIVEEKKCDHVWEKYCTQGGCVDGGCNGHRGRLCSKCKIDKCDALLGDKE